MGSLTFYVINYNYRLHRNVWLQLQLKLHPFSNVINYNSITLKCNQLQLQITFFFRGGVHICLAKLYFLIRLQGSLMKTWQVVKIHIHHVHRSTISLLIDKANEIIWIYTTGRKIYCECHFLLIITANYCPCTVSVDNYCHFYCQCCELLSFTVPFTVSAASYCHLLSLYCRYCELLSFTVPIDHLARALELRLRLNTQGKWLLYKDFFFQNHFL
jgi:hypothetical protein